MPEHAVLVSFDQVGRNVQDLFDSAEQRYPEWGLDWFLLLARNALKPDEQAALACSELIEKGQAGAVLPLRLGKRHGRLASLSTFYTSLFSPIVEPAACAPEALEQIFRNLRRDRWSVLQLSPMSRDDTIFDVTLHSLNAAGWRAFPYFCFGNWYLPVGGRSFETYYSSLPSQVRNTVNRRRKKFLAGSRGRLEMIGDEIEGAIRVWTDIYNASWKIPEPFPEFMPELIRLCARKGWLRMAIAYYEQTPIAAQIWIVHQGRAAIYKLAYDEKYAEHSAGTLLTAFLMQHVLDVDQVHEVDYLIGDETYKQDWVSHRRERWGIVAYNPRTLRGLAGWIREAGGRWVKLQMKKRNASTIT